MPAACPADHELSEFVTGELHPAGSTAIADHLRECPSCSARVRGLEQVAAVSDNILGELRKPAPEEPSDPEFRAALERLVAAPPAGPLPPVVGDVLDEYRLVEVLGEGGMGVVYRAIHVRLDKEVALKVIRRSRSFDPHAIDRFGREMKAAGRARHPNLVQATDAGVAGEIPFLVMEYVPGTDLTRLVLRDGPLPLDRACGIICQAASGLHHAHENGLVHRDVKPSNLILGTDGIVRVLDLGLALLPGEPAPATVPVVDADTSGGPDDTLTSPGQQLGTRHYSAPEQQQDSHRVGPGADIYGLGGTLAFLLTGRAYRRGEPFPPQLPAEIWKRLLAPFPEDRYPTAAAVADALAPYCAHPEPAPPHARRGWLVAVALATAAAALALAMLPRDPEANVPALTPTPPPAPVATAPSPRAVPPNGLLPMTAAEAQRLQKQHAEHRGQPIAVKNSLGMDMILIPPGEFAMSEVYSVVISKPFRMAATEVTFAQYAQFCTETGYRTAAERVKVGARFRTWKPLAGFPQAQDPVHRLAPGWGKYADDQPIGYLTWDDINRFVDWLSAREERRYRLPTHAEWEWACRAGTATQCFWGDDAAELNKYAWMRNSGADRPQPVGKLLPNAWGLFDMLGNVEEIVQDYHVIDHTPTGRGIVDPVGPPKSANRVTCGGSHAEVFRLTPRLSGVAMNTVVYSNQGFRVVLEP